MLSPRDQDEDDGVRRRLSRPPSGAAPTPQQRAGSVHRPSSALRRTGSSRLADILEGGGLRSSTRTPEQQLRRRRAASKVSKWLLVVMAGAACILTLMQGRCA